MSPGQICKGVTQDDLGDHTKKSPLREWNPRSGEVVGFMVSTPARSAVRSSNERSNVFFAIWP
ncbi:MAG: hypothetical protein ABL958_13545 [Bdellovibrionia bacterium]